ncbi:MAG: hypothetical protein KKH22_06980, partial [Proteobacteria bacterium]|nr:hypothetical protein [Pseudomonadota bacterium]
ALAYAVFLFFIGVVTGHRPGYRGKHHPDCPEAEHHLDYPVAGHRPGCREERHRDYPEAEHRLDYREVERHPDYREVQWLCSFLISA